MEQTEATCITGVTHQKRRFLDKLSAYIDAEMQHRLAFTGAGAKVELDPEYIVATALRKCLEDIHNDQVNAELDEMLG